MSPHKTSAHLLRPRLSPNAKKTDRKVDRIQYPQRETTDQYFSIIIILNDCWRVIVCRGGFQRILQRKDAQRSGHTRWTGRSYFTTRTALMRVIRALCGAIQPAAVTILQILSEDIRDYQEGKA